MITTESTSTLAQMVNLGQTVRLPSLVIIENEQSRPEALAKIIKSLTLIGFHQAVDHKSILEILPTNQGRVVYVEEGESLDSLVLDIVVNYASGFVSLMDRSGGRGLVSVRFAPERNVFWLIMTRVQVEKSYPALFEYVGVIESI